MENGARRTEDGRPSVAVVDYRAGNLTSLLKGLSAAGAHAFVSSDPEAIRGAAGIVVPGVGHFAATAAIDEGLRAAIVEGAGHDRPLLGICLGLQFLFDGSEEAPDARGLGLLSGRCTFLRGDVKVPHVGWNTLERKRDSALLVGVDSGAYVYFTHSYAAPITDACVASTAHGADFAAIVDDGRRVFGVQFHPEKSGEDGMRILRNFVALCR